MSTSYQPSPEQQTQGAGRGHHEHHVMPVWVLLSVYAALIVLTILTVVFANVDLKIWVKGLINEYVYEITAKEISQIGLIIAMILATTKAVLVALFFMHLKYDRAFNGIIFIGTMVFVALFIGITLMDSVNYTVGSHGLRSEIRFDWKQEQIQDDIYQERFNVRSTPQEEAPPPADEEAAPESETPDVDPDPTTEPQDAPPPDPDAEPGPGEEDDPDLTGESPA